MSRNPFHAVPTWNTAPERERVDHRISLLARWLLRGSATRGPPRGAPDADCPLRFVVRSHFELRARVPLLNP